MLGKRDRAVSLSKANTSKKDAREPLALRKTLEETVVEEKIKAGVAALRQALELSPATTKSHKLVQLLLGELQSAKASTFSGNLSAKKLLEAEVQENTDSVKELVKELSTAVKQIAT